MAREFEPALRELVREVLKQEVPDARAAIGDVLQKSGSDAMKKWTSAYYNKGAFRKRFFAALDASGGDALRRYAQTVRGSLAAEMKGAEVTDAMFGQFCDAYIESFYFRYKYRSRKLLDGARFKGYRDGLPPDGIAGRMQAELDRWETSRPRNVGKGDPVRLAGELTRFVASSRGFRVKWVVTSSHPCKICAKLDGRVVGATGRYGDHDVKRMGTRRSPPMHAGCHCVLALEPGYSEKDPGFAPRKGETVREKIEAGEFSTRLSPQKHARHVEGTKEFAEYARLQAERGKSAPGKLNKKTAEQGQAFIEQYAGTGDQKWDKKGGVLNYEWVDADEYIGEYEEKGVYYKTRRAQIVYAKNGAHLMPAKEW
jgi:hypothetical protein